MRPPWNNFDQCLRCLPDPLLLTIGLAVVGVGWYATSRWYGYAVAVVAAAIAIGQSHAPVGGGRRLRRRSARPLFRRPGPPRFDAASLQELIDAADDLSESCVSWFRPGRVA